ncbi:MAG: L,D-transpeptidase [Cyanophyceae cyanobacterium]
MLPNTIRRMGELRQGQRKWLEINLSTQRLIAWEGGKPVYAVIVSTGKPATPTYSGVYSIYRKQHPERMRGRGYDIPNVPHAMYYHRGYAIHGAYWHSRFGTPVSHGCTNVAPNHARWLYNWASVGTPVVVHR